MDDYSSRLSIFSGPIEELILILKKNDIDSLPVKEFLHKHEGKEYIGNIESAKDIKELLMMGLII